MKNEKLKIIIERTADVFGVDPIAVLSRQRGNNDVCDARGVCALLLRPHLDTAQIGSLLGRRQYQYYSGSVRKVFAKGAKDSRYWKKVIALLNEFSVELPQP
jgi:chromosomal replication initiation ATPase DnaA